MALTFTTPLVYDVPTVDADTRGVAWRHRRFYSPNARGVNVYVYADGSVSQSDPVHTTAELAGEVAPVSTYYGGHVYLISAAEQAVLTAAGYGPNITNPVVPPPVVDPHTPQPGLPSQAGIPGGSYGASGYGLDHYGGT